MIALLALLGCGEPEPLAEDTAILVLCDPSLKADLVDGQGAPLTEAEIQVGPGGGWHVELFLEIYNLDPASNFASIEFTGAVDGQIVVSTYSWLEPIATGDACEPWRTPGLYGYIDPSGLAQGDCRDPRELLDGATLDLDVAVSDELGEQLELSAEVLLWSDAEVCD